MSTIKQILDLVDQLRENAFPASLKARWIGELDALVALDVMGMDVGDVTRFRYDPDADGEKEALLRFPHDSLYHYWLCAKIDAENGEYGRYQNSLKLYNAAFLDYRTWYSRVYDPARQKASAPTPYFRHWVPGTGQSLTVGQLVQTADLLRENALPQEIKVRWIGELDALIAADVMGLDVLELEQFRYDPEADLDRQPLVRFPHNCMYHYWLCAKIDAENGEYNRYQNSMQLYNAAFLSFRTWFSRVYQVFGSGTAEPTHYLSAYGLAVQQGYPGTLEQWLRDLIGPVGPQGPKGEKGDPGKALADLTEAELEMLRGPAGESVKVADIDQSYEDGGQTVVRFTDGKAMLVFNGRRGGEGKAGRDGTSVRIVDTVQSGADGGANVVSFSDGTTLRVYNGKRGSQGPAGAPGDDGKTPVKGVDYYTPDDRAEMVSAVMAALPAWKGGSY